MRPFRALAMVMVVGTAMAMAIRSCGEKRSSTESTVNSGSRPQPTAPPTQPPAATTPKSTPPVGRVPPTQPTIVKLPDYEDIVHPPGDSPPVPGDGTAQKVDREHTQTTSGNPAINLDDQIKELQRRLELLEHGMLISPNWRFPQMKTSPSLGQRKVEDDGRRELGSLERSLIERNGLLLPPWAMEIEPSLTYAHASSENVSIDGVSIESTVVVGKLISDKIRRNFLVPALTFRLGLPYEFQAETKIPFRYESARTVMGDSSEHARDDFGLGDIEVALSHQFMRESERTPDILGSMRWKTDTGHSPDSLETDELALGTGYHTLQFMLTSVKVKEPGAFFGSLLYALNFPVSKAQGRLSPGDSWGLNLGLALALNANTSFNFLWEQKFTEQSRLNGVGLQGSSRFPGTFRVGTTYTLSPAVSLDFAVILGLTGDAPDVQAIIAIPVYLPERFAHKDR